MSDESLTLSIIDRIVMDLEDGMRAFARDHGAERPSDLTHDELKALQMWVWSRQWWEDATPEARAQHLAVNAALEAEFGPTKGPFYIATRDGIYFGPR